MKILKVVLSMSFIFSSYASASSENLLNDQMCGVKFIETFEDNILNTQDRLIRIYNLPEMVEFFDGSKVKAGAMWSTLVLLSPVFVPMIGLADTSENRMNSYYDFVGKAILNPNSYEAEKGLQILYEQLSEEFEVSESEFLDFFINDFEKSRLCKMDSELVLTERGKKIIGDERSFTSFAMRNVGTKKWRDFWDDHRNFDSVPIYRPLNLEEIKTVLTNSYLINSL